MTYVTLGCLFLRREKEERREGKPCSQTSSWVVDQERLGPNRQVIFLSSYKEKEEEMKGGGQMVKCLVDFQSNRLKRDIDVSSLSSLSQREG